MKKFRFITQFQDTRGNNEDFAITPFLFSVIMRGEIIKIYGLGLCWGHWSRYFAIGINVPDNWRREIGEMKNNQVPMLEPSKMHTDANNGWIKFEIPQEVLLLTRMHLTQDMIRMLLPTLQKFAETGEL